MCKIDEIATNNVQILLMFNFKCLHNILLLEIRFNVH